MKGRGVDCAGLALCSARTAGYAVTDAKGYSRLPNSDQMQRIIESQCEVISELEVGAILFIKHTGTLHLAIVTQLNPTYIIHAYEPAGKVVEHILDFKWARRVSKIYRASLWPH